MHAVLWKLLTLKFMTRVNLISVVNSSVLHNSQHLALQFTFNLICHALLKLANSTQFKGIWHLILLWYA